MWLYGLVGYVLLLTLIVLVMLFGRHAWCRGTVVGWLYDVITLRIPGAIEYGPPHSVCAADGAYRRGFTRICGSGQGRIGGCFRWLEEICCHRPNPVLQVRAVAHALGLTQGSM